MAAVGRQLALLAAVKDEDETEDETKGEDETKAGDASSVGKGGVVKRQYQKTDWRREKKKIK